MREGSAGRNLTRAFELVHVPLEGRPGTRTANRITCGCGATDITGGNKLVPPEAAIRDFKRKGWHVGNKPKHDVCPECVAKGTKRAPKLTLVPTQHIDAEGIIHHDLELRDMKPASDFAETRSDMREHPTADAPRTMSIDDRRIIYEKISDVYVGPETGYSKGWTDKKIGADLGVPWAWVKEVRTTLFGEKEGNEEIAAVQAALAQIEADHLNVSKNLGTLIREATKLKETMSSYEMQLHSIVDRLDRQRSILKRLEG